MQVTGRELGRIVERAIDWALARTGDHGYALRCLAFVEDAYEQANGIEVFGGSSATESAVLYGAEAATGEPPRGAYVFFGCSGPVEGITRDWGHVGLALGDRRMVHGWDTVRVDPIEDIPRLVGAPGWSAPAYLGWAPPSRILADAVSRPRDGVLTA